MQVNKMSVDDRSEDKTGRNLLSQNVGIVAEWPGNRPIDYLPPRSRGLEWGFEVLSYKLVVAYKVICRIL